MIVASTRVPLFTVIAFDLSSAATASNRTRARPCATSTRRKRTKDVRSGVASVPEEPQNRRKKSTVGERFGQLDVGEVIPDRQPHRLEHRERWPGGLALRRGIERGQQRRDRLPVNYAGQRVQRRSPLPSISADAELRLPNPPLRHRSLRLIQASNESDHIAPKQSPAHRSPRCFEPSAWFAKAAW